MWTFYPPVGHLTHEPRQKCPVAGPVAAPPSSKTVMVNNRAVLKAIDLQQSGSRKLNEDLSTVTRTSRKFYADTWWPHIAANLNLLPRIQHRCDSGQDPRRLQTYVSRIDFSGQLFRFVDL